MKMSFSHGVFPKLAGMAYSLVLSTSSVLAAEIPAAADSPAPVAIVNGQSISDAELASAAAAQLRQLYLREYQVKRAVLESPKPSAAAEWLFQKEGETNRDH